MYTVGMLPNLKAVPNFSLHRAVAHCMAHKYLRDSYLILGSIQHLTAVTVPHVRIVTICMCSNIKELCAGPREDIGTNLHFNLKVGSR